jgi:hypothetical protein
VALLLELKALVVLMAVALGVHYQGKWVESNRVSKHELLCFCCGHARLVIHRTLKSTDQHQLWPKLLAFSSLPQPFYVRSQVRWQTGAA